MRFAEPAGKIVHVDGTPEAEALFIRLDLLLPDGSIIIFAAPVLSEDHTFELAVLASNAKLVRLLITDTIHCVRQDDVWNALGSYEL